MHKIKHKQKVITIPGDLNYTPNPARHRSDVKRYTICALILSLSALTAYTLSLRLISQIHYLRAKNFMQQGYYGLASQGLQKAAAHKPNDYNIQRQWGNAVLRLAEISPSSKGAYALAEKAKAKGLDPAKDFNFKLLLFSGEPGAGIPSTRKRIEETYGGICIDSGSTGEMSPWMTNCECSHRQGMHLWQDIVYAELVTLDTKKRVPYGQEGVTVYTHLERTSQPMIRYLAGDVSLWVNDPCPCGRTYPRLPNGIYGRADDMFVVRGENVTPSAIEDVIRGIDGLGDEFRVVITREKTMDELIVQAEWKEDVNTEGIPALKAKLEKELKARGLRTVVQMLEPNSLERTEFKAKRVIDQRGLYEEIIGKE